MIEYKTMKEIGEILHLSSHQIGRKLKALGLRTTQGKPSQSAYNRGLVKTRWAKNKELYLWTWRADKIIELLITEMEMNNPSLQEPPNPYSDQLW
jgi:hypothetical protein